MLAFPLLAFLLLALIALFGCSEPQWQTSYRLERSFALAETYWDTLEINVGTEEGRVWLVDGWSWNESNDSGETFVWSNGRTSSFGLMVFDPRDSVLHLRGFPFPEGTDSNLLPQSVALLVKDSAEQDRTVGVAVLGGGMTEHSLPIPSESLKRGRNDFSLHYNWIRSDLPSQATTRWNRDQRDLGVAWSSISLANDNATPRGARTGIPQSTTDLINRSLSLAVGSWSEYEFELEAGSRIAVDAIRCVACGSNSVVEVYLGGLERTEITKVGSLTGASKALALVVPTSSQTPPTQTHTLILRVTDTSESAQGNGFVTLESPRIERPTDVTFR